MTDVDRATQLDHAVLVGRAGDSALLVRDDGSLPVIQAPEDGYAAEVVSAAADVLGRRPTLLRIAQVLGTHDEPTLNVIELDAIDGEAPDGHRWLPIDQVSAQSFEPPALGGQVDYWRRSRLEGPTSRRPPWSRAGWFERASRWMTERMAEAGRPATGPPELYHLWTISGVLRAPTERGPMFLKSCAPLFRAEPALTALIASRTPELAPSVAAIEPSEGWLLMDDLGGRHLGDEPPGTWAAGLEAFATIQQAWAGDTASLVEAGAPVRSLPALAGDLPALVDRVVARGPVVDADLDAIRGAMPELALACNRLDEIGPDPTLVHGDLHPWNVAVGAGGPIVYDWSDAAVGHPFIDLPVFVRRAEDPAVRRTLRSAYLARWSDVLSPAALEEAGDLALVVGSVYQAQSYVAILESLDPEDRFDMAAAGGVFLRFAVAMLRDGIEGGSSVGA